MYTSILGDQAAQLVVLGARSVKELIGAERASLYVVDPVRRELWTPIAGVEGMTEIRLPLAIDGAWVTDDTPIILGVDHKEHKRDGIAVH